MTVTTEGVQGAVEDIRALAEAGDSAGAHLAEDDLYDGILAAIADGDAEDPKAMAAAALATQDIDFVRRY